MVNPSTLAYVPRTTNIARGICSTVDFVTLLLGNAGPGGIGLSHIYDALSTWRNKPLNANGQVGCCNYLFNRIYGYVSHSFDPSDPWCEFFYRFGTTGTSLWYRTYRGVYALNANGVERYQRLCAG